MPRKIQPLTDAQARTAKPSTKAQRLFDGGGLYLEISPAGGKLWRFKYRMDGKEKLLSIGAYPTVGLKEARDKREDARKLMVQGIDPAVQKKALKLAKAQLNANSFEIIAREWFEKFRSSRTVGHTSKVVARLERDVFPWIGGKPITAITAPDVLAVLRRIENRGAIETAHRAKGDVSQIMRYAIATGRAERDPCPDLKGALTPAAPKHFAAIIDPKEVGAFLRTLEIYSGTLTVRVALKLAPLLFCRPGELRHMKWSEIDLETAEWRYTTSKTKTDHLVPLARQAVAALRELEPLTGRHEYVFTGHDPKRPMSGNTINAALRRMGFDTQNEITGHGFRAMARTILAEQLHIKPEVIEHQLAHKVPDSHGGAYNRTRFIKERIAMMQQWADYLDKLRTGADIVSIRSKVR
ncbi:MAG: tyrosine-type recombinase/integrase [Burkholderiaceae bacterium]|jgi:integrase